MGLPTIAVAGGGVTGLSAAWEIANRSPSVARVVVLEADVHLGGKIRSSRFGGRPVELGADAFVARRDEAVGLCGELGIAEHLVAPSTDGAYVFARGRLRRLPGGLVLGVPTLLGPLARSGICSTGGLLRVAGDWLGLGTDRTTGRDGEPEADEAVGDIVRERLGAQVHDRLADPLIGGIHAGPIDAMSAAAVFPELLRAAGRGGSLMRRLRSSSSSPAQAPGLDLPVFLRPGGGMDELVERLVVSLEDRGVELRTGEEVRSVCFDHRDGLARWDVRTDKGTVVSDGLVVALPATSAGSLLEGTDAAMSRTLRSVPYASVTVVTLSFPEDGFDVPAVGSGFLVPANCGMLTTACTWMSQKWRQLSREGEVLVRVSMGRHGDSRHLELSDEHVVDVAVRELGSILRTSATPIDSMVTRWPEAFPQYLVGHDARVRELEEASRRLPPMALAGAALHGVGIPACIGSGRRAARTVLTRLGSAGGTR